MADVNWELIILIIVVGLIVFAGMGIFIGTRISSDKRRIKELEDELADTRKDLEGYRSKVNNHFKKTSELFTQMTSSYKAVYLHLAEGSQELCTTDAALLNPSNGEFLKVAHEKKKPAVEEVPQQVAEEPVQPIGTSGQQEHPEPESSVIPPEGEGIKKEQQEPSAVADEVKEYGNTETAEPLSSLEKSENQQTETLKAESS